MQRLVDKILLLPFAFKAYVGSFYVPKDQEHFSEFNEDEIITEVFRDIGKKTKKLVEIGIGYGLNSNTVRLLLDGWSGYWIDMSKLNIIVTKRLLKRFNLQRVEIIKARLTPENINKVIPFDNYDLISIDVDGNDFYLWQAMKYAPRVVVIEFNNKIEGGLFPYMENPYDYSHDEKGASLRATTELAASKGYVFFGATPTNAVFVRRD